MRIPLPSTVSDASMRLNPAGLGSLFKSGSRFLFAAEALVIAAIVAAAAPSLWQSRWVHDDAYVSFRYARNLVDGHGLVYNPGERVEGYTNFLWTVMSALPLAAGTEDPLPAMHLLEMGLWLGTCGLLVLLGLALAHRGVLIGPLIALPLIVLWSSNQWFLSGMETGIASFLMVLLIALLTVQDLHRPARAALLGLTATALLLARPDTAFFIAGVAFGGLLCQWRWLTERTFWNSWVLALLLPVVVVHVPYTGWRLGYYGDFFPNTYDAKMAYLPAYDLPEGTVLVQDDGRWLFHLASLQVSGVSAGRDLIMVVRHDRNAFSRFLIFVNGRQTPRPLTLERSGESWAEEPVVIPGDLLVDGTNQIELTKDPTPTEVAELYSVWFLQPISASAPDPGRREPVSGIDRGP